MKYEEELKAVSLINLIDETKTDLLYEELEACDVIDNFSKKLKKIFKNKADITANILSLIERLEDKDIFLENYLLTSEYKDNEIRIIISDYLNSLKKVYFSFPVVLKKIKGNYKLYNYLSYADKTNLDNIKKLRERNPKVLLLVDANILTPEFILECMQESDFVSQIFAGFYGVSNSLYLFSDKFLGNKEIEKLLYRELKKSLDNDINTYLTYSSLARNNLNLAKLVLKKEPNFLKYVGDNVLKNKSIMKKMLDINEDNIMYFNAN